jgi:hypothetical protein
MARTVQSSVQSNSDPRFHGKAITANARFGTTGTHFAVLFAIWGMEKAGRASCSYFFQQTCVDPGSYAFATYCLTFRGGASHLKVSDHRQPETKKKGPE